MPSKSALTTLIKNKAFELGFVLCGMSRAVFMDEEARRVEAWLNNNYNGEMGYLDNHFDMRVDPTKLVPGAKSVISVAYNYYTTEKQADSEAPKVSMYAFGRDYHKVVKNKLKLLFTYVQSVAGDIYGRAFVDSAPVLEKDWAARSGLGWRGRHGLLINPKKGSYFFLGELILDLELDYDHPIKDFCGTCRRCIDACPTDAISSEGYFINASQCITYVTVELRAEVIPDEFKGKMENWAFGCDICQQVCPWNKFAAPHQEPDFTPRPFLNMTKEEWQDITEPIYEEVFFGTPVKRARYEGLKRNIRFLDNND